MSDSRTSHLIRALAVTAVLAGYWCAAPAAAGEHSIGVGLHYWQTLDDLVDGAGLEEDGVSLLLAYQYAPSRGLLRFEIDLEYFDEGFGGSPDAAYAPVAYLVVGGKLYVAAGFGVTFSSGLDDSPSDPFYTGRLGFQLELLPGLLLDFNANYRTNAFEELGDFDVDTLTLGVIARVKI
ncbi:MAG TPA: hypothetical protein VGG06_10150 [Thermoanaerobaculia bacterium]|jgi:hypothetical protein